MLTVHHLEHSRSQRILWTLEELSLPYTVKRYDRHPRTMLAPSALRAVHPLGKSPTVEHDGQVLVESGAIVEYLLELGDGRLRPPAARAAQLRHRQFLHYAEGSLMPPLFAMLVVQKLGLLGLPAKKTIASLVARQLEWLDDELGDAAFFVGDELTGADIMLSFPVEAAASRAPGTIGPRLSAWLARIHARPAYRRALATGGAYRYA